MQSIFNQGQNQLPVSSTQPDQSYFIQGLPHNFPNGLPVNPQNQIQADIAGPTIGYLLLELQDKSGSNQIRTFTFNMLSQGGYQNENFQATAISALEYAEMMCATGSVAPDTAAQTAAKEIASIMTSVFANQYPVLLNAASPNAREAVAWWLNRFNEIQQEIQRYQSYRQNNNQMNGWNNGGAMMGNRGGAPNYQSGGHFGHTPIQGGNMNGGMFTPGGGNMMRPSGTTGVPGNSSNPMFGNATTPLRQNDGMGASNRFNEVPASGRGRRPEGKITYGAPPPRGSEEKKPEVERSTNAQPHNAATDSLSAHCDEVTTTFQGEQSGRVFDKHKFGTEKAMDAMTMEEAFSDQPFEDAFDNLDNDQMLESDIIYSSDGSVTVPAKYSSAKITTDLRVIGPVVYDPAEYVKYHVTNKDNIVTERFEEADAVADYNRLKMSPTPQSNLPNSSKPKVDPNFRLLAEARVVPKDFDTEDEKKQFFEDIKSTPKVLELPDVFWAHSARDAACAADLFLIRNNMGDVPKKQPIEFRYESILPYADRKIDGDSKISDVLKATFNLTTIEEYVAQLNKLNDQESFPDQLVSDMNRRSTDLVNSAVSVGLNLKGWGIDSIMADWEDLKAAITKKYGEEQSTALFKTLENKAASDIISGGLRFVEDEDFENLFAKTGPLYHYAGQKDKLFVLAEFNTQTRVPWRAEDISLVLEDGEGVVLESRTPKLFSAIKGIIERSQKSVEIRKRHFILTADNYVLEIKRGLLSDKYFVISEVM